jgi:hypothetical protein
MDCALILLCKRAVGALKLAFCGANIFKRHFGDLFFQGGQLQFFADAWWHKRA